LKRDVRARRTSSRTRWSREGAQRVIAQQATRVRRRAVADAVIHNDGITLAMFEAAVREVWHWWHEAMERVGPSGPA